MPTGHPMAVTLGKQIVETGSPVLQTSVSDAVRGLHVHSGKLVRPDAITLAGRAAPARYLTQRYLAWAGRPTHTPENGGHHDRTYADRGRDRQPGPRCVPNQGAGQTPEVANGNTLPGSGSSPDGLVVVVKTGDTATKTLVARASGSGVNASGNA